MRRPTTTKGPKVHDGIFGLQSSGTSVSFVVTVRVAQVQFPYPMTRSGINPRLRDLARLRTGLLAWYRQNRRDLPWRRTRDPYRIWVSEIMLQQTRVGAVVDRYERFLQRFPTVQKLASAHESSILAEWSGLGYYRRARNLHAAAKVLAAECGGQFPRTAAGLRQLPGIGRYTAAAIASIAFGEPVAVVDGNVERVISRLVGEPKLSGEPLWQLAESVLSPHSAGDWNQAMMELGATVCLPAEPKCLECPIRKSCRTRGSHQNGARKPRPFKREIAYRLHRRQDAVLLIRRGPHETLMPGMWELPEVRLTRSDQSLFSMRHSITVTDYLVRVVSGESSVTGTWIRNSRLEKLALTGLTKKILRRAGII